MMGRQSRRRSPYPMPAPGRAILSRPPGSEIVGQPHPDLPLLEGLRTLQQFSLISSRGAK